MNDVMVQSLFFGVMISLAVYEAGLFIKKKTKLAIMNPLLVSIVLLIAILVVFDIDYDTYAEGAKYLSYFLTPATVCLAVPLYQQIELLKKHSGAILAGIVSGALTSGVCILALSILLGLSHTEYVTLLPKSITTAIGMVVSEELGGVVTITVAVIVITGVLGGIIADFVCKIFRITEPVAKGIALGSSAHVIGTVKAMEMGEVEGAMSSLSIAVSGVITVFLAPLFASLF